MRKVFRCACQESGCDHFAFRSTNAEEFGFILAADTCSSAGLQGMRAIHGAAGLKTGRAIFEAGCAGCHGGNGKGAPETTTAFDRPATFPDFTECDQTTPEDNLAWISIIRDGGTRRGFSQIMPWFGGALTSEQIDAVVGYLRTSANPTDGRVEN